MRIGKVLSTAVLAAGIAIASAEAANAQGMQSGTGQETTGQGMMQGRGMEHCMMHGGMGSRMMEEHMRGGMMGRGMMMGSMMGPGMMQGERGADMSALFGSRVRPLMNLSVEDVRGYLASQLERLNNKRLKVGDLKSDDRTITADIVTVDNSLVQRLKVDRHTGAIEYES